MFGRGEPANLGTGYMQLPYSPSVIVKALEPYASICSQPERAATKADFDLETS